MFYGNCSNTNIAIAPTTGEDLVQSYPQWNRKMPQNPQITAFLEKIATILVLSPKSSRDIYMLNKIRTFRNPFSGWFRRGVREKFRKVSPSKKSQTLFQHNLNFHNFQKFLKRHLRRLKTLFSKFFAIAPPPPIGSRAIYSPPSPRAESKANISSASKVGTPTKKLAFTQ